MIDIKSQIIKPALNLEDLKVVASAEGWKLTDLHSLGFFLNRNFKYRRAIKITEQSGSDLTDYQVLIELNSTNFDFSHAQTNGEDIRFADTDGNLLSYWIEEWDSVNKKAKIWVKVPSIPADSSIEIFMYYGNPEITSASDASATFIRVIDGLVASWHFDEGAGTTAYDSSGNDNDGTIYGATWADGKFKKALNFDGSDDYVTIPHDASFDVDKVTITAWFKADALGYNWRKIVCHPYYDDQWSDPYSVYALGIDNANKILGEISIGTSNVKVGGSVLNTGLWYFAAMTFDGEFLKIYLNSVEEDSLSVSGSLNHRSTKVHIAKAYDAANTELFDGIIDEVCIFNRALTQEEISDLYNNYGYSTENYPGKVLVRKYTEPEPSVSLRAEETA